MQPVIVAEMQVTSRLHSLGSAFEVLTPWQTLSSLGQLVCRRSLLVHSACCCRDLLDVWRVNFASGLGECLENAGIRDPIQAGTPNPGSLSNQLKVDLVPSKMERPKLQRKLSVSL